MLRFNDDDFQDFEICTEKAPKKLKKKRLQSEEQNIPDVAKVTAPVVPKPAWIDEDEPENLLNIRTHAALDIHQRNEELRRNRIQCDELSDPEEDCMPTIKSSKILRTGRSKELVASSNIAVLRLPDANRERLSRGPICCVEFNPKFHMLLTASVDSTLALFKLNHFKSTLLKDRVHERYKLSSAKFTADGHRIVFTGDNNTFRIFDLDKNEETRSMGFIGASQKEVLSQCHLSPSDCNLGAFVGLNGIIYIADLRNLEKIAMIRCSGEVNSICFSQKGNYLNAMSALGSIFVFDLRSSINMGRLVHRWVDEGCTSGSSIALSPASNWTACGSDSGYVNLYNFQTGFHPATSNPKPTHSIGNLTSRADLLAFHPSNELLCFASSAQKAAIRLFHLEARHTFANFPILSGRLDRPTAIAFSPDQGGLVAIGQANGRVALCQLLHYRHY